MALKGLGENFVFVPIHMDPLKLGEIRPAQQVKRIRVILLRIEHPSLE